MPITRDQQQLFGAELRRRREGEKPRLKKITIEKLRELIGSRIIKKKDAR